MFEGIFQPMHLLVVFGIALWLLAGPEPPANHQTWMGLNVALLLLAIAAASTAIPGTLGSAGFAWPEAEAFVLAEAIHRIVSDGAVRETLRGWGRRRYEEEFTGERIEAGFREALQRLFPAELQAQRIPA